MAPGYRIDPRIRAFGKARIDVTQRARDEREWQSMWREPRFGFPFAFGDGWKHSMQYLVEDFAAEVGFYIDVLGFPVSAFSPSYAQFTSPAGEFHFSISQAEASSCTPPHSLSMQFRIEDLANTIEDLEKRGVTFDRKPENKVGSPAIATLHTPHGVQIELWGIEEQPSNLPADNENEVEPSVGFWAADDEDDVEQPLDEDKDDDLESATLAGEDPLTEPEAVEEPVYVDDDDEVNEVQSPMHSTSQDRSPNPSSPLTRVIRSSEGFLGDNRLVPGRKVKGNGQRGFPTVENRFAERDE